MNLRLLHVLFVEAHSIHWESRQERLIMIKFWAIYLTHALPVHHLESIRTW